MSKKLYVGNLSFNTTEDGLYELFSTHGQITSANLVIDKMTGRSRGFGFVEFAENDAADTAVAQLNNTEHDGRKLIVNEARPMKPKEKGGFGGNKSRNKGPRRW